MDTFPAFFWFRLEGIDLMNCGNQKENATYISNFQIEMYTNQFNSIPDKSDSI